MNGPSTPKSSRAAMPVIIIFFIFILGGWLFLQHLSPGKMGEEGQAKAAREEMAALQDEARRAGAPALAEEPFRQGVAFAREGDQEYDEGNFTGAKVSYLTAADFFREAIRGAGANFQPEVKAEEESSPIQPALAAQEEMLGHKNRASGARAQTLAADAFKRAAQQEQQAEQAFSAGDYVQAARFFESAGEQYKAAHNQARAKALEAETDLTAIKKTVQSMKQEMLLERAAAEQYENISLARSRLELARKKEQSGDRSFRSGTKNGYLSAQAFYAEAKDEYRLAREEAREGATRNRDAQPQPREEEPPNQLRREAEQARTAMEDAKSRIPNGLPERTANAAYQNAASIEAEGNKLFQSGNFQNALRSFRLAKDYYAQADREIAKIIDENEAKKEEGARMAAAKSEIQGLIDSYREKLEGEDIEGMKFFEKNLNEKEWEMVFKNAQNISTHIEDKNIETDGQTARVTFRLRISFFNSSQNRKEEYPLSKSWWLAKVDGRWKILSSK